MNFSSKRKMTYFFFRFAVKIDNWANSNLLILIFIFVKDKMSDLNRHYMYELFVCDLIIQSWIWLMNTAWKVRMINIKQKDSAIFEYYALCFAFNIRLDS